MRLVVFTTLFAAVSCWAQGSGSVAAAAEAPSAAGQAAAQPQSGLAQPPNGAAGPGRGGLPARPSNEQLNVDVDRFIGYPLAKTTHLSHGTLLIHSILTHGDPYTPGPQGAVLEYREELATATLLPGSETPASTLQDAFFFYVKSGEGR